MPEEKRHSRSILKVTVPPGKGSRYSEVDDTVLRRCIQGDREALQMFAHTYQGAVRRLLARTIFPRPSPADLDDLVQEAFARAVKAIGTFDPSREARVSTWLMKIAINHSLDWIKKRDLHRGNRIEYEHSERSRRSGSPSPEDVVERKRLGEVIESVLAELPDEQRRAFVLFHYEDRSYEEIAEICGTIVANVKTRLHRARAYMQAQVKRRFQ